MSADGRSDASPAHSDQETFTGKVMFMDTRTKSRKEEFGDRKAGLSDELHLEHPFAGSRMPRDLTIDRPDQLCIIWGVPLGYLTC